MRTQFRLLGGIEARVDGQVVDAGHLRQWCVLASLLLDANEAVPVDELIDRVWGKRPPQRARETLYGYVSRLRANLAAGDDVRIVRGSSGYRLIVDPDAVDVHRFARLIAAARASRDDESAWELFAQAFELWRGKAFAVLDTPWLNDARARLERARLTAELERHELALRLGRQARVLDEMFAASKDHPLHEELAGQLMTALYRAGRQGEALACYRQLRRRLVDELGVEPGEPLRRLHERMLRADPVLTSAAEVRLPLPRQVPVPPTTFAGRVTELVDLTRLCTPGVVCAIIGPGGLGKTWLAQRLAFEQRSGYPDGQLYVDLRGFDPAGAPVPTSVALRGFLGALGVTPDAVPASFDAQTALYRTLLADRRLLIVLDNARDSAHVEALLPRNGTCTVVVTSRHQLTALVTEHGARPFALGLLSDRDARQILVADLGAPRVAAEPIAVDALLRHCGGLPLALGIVAARAAVRPDLRLETVAAQLSVATTRLDALDAGELTVNLRAVLASSVDSLAPTAGRLFALLGALPGPRFGLGAAASLVAQPIPAARMLLGHLVSAHLITEIGPDRYHSHDLVRLYAAEQAETLAEQSVARQRLLDHYRATAFAANRLLAPLRQPIVPAPPAPGVSVEPLADNVAARAWFAAELADLLATIRRASEEHHDLSAWQLAWAIATYLDRNALWHDQATVHTAAVAAAKRLGDRDAHAYALRGLASALIWLGEYPKARRLLHRALGLFEDGGGVAERANLYRTLARSHARQGRPRRALPHDEQALRLYRSAGDPCGEATVMNAIGWHHTHLGEHAKALEFCEQALALQQKIGDHYGAAVTADSLGYIRRELGQADQAIHWYRHAVDLFDHAGDRYEMADTLASLGETYAAIGFLDQAQAARQQAVAELDQLGIVAAPLRARLTG